MMRQGLCAVAAAAVLAAGCFTSPAPAPHAAADDAQIAAGALEAGDYARAADLYRRLIAKQPGVLGAHYGLAVAASFLDLRPEAIREFRWVLDNGAAGSSEVETARQWLVKVGALTTASRSADARPEIDRSQPSAAEMARIEGRAVSPEDSAPLKRQQLFLVDQPNRSRRLQVRTAEDGTFRFASVPPGIYHLSDKVTGPALWRLRVEPKPGQVVFLDLGPGNSTKVREDFPAQ